MHFLASRLGRPTFFARRAWRSIVLLGLPLLIVLALLVIELRPDSKSLTSPAQSDWTPTSLTVETDALAADRQTASHLFAGTVSGCWRSLDLGLHWQRDPSWKASAAVLALAAAPKQPTLFAGASDGAIYERSLSEGGPWTRISPNLDGNPIYSIAVSSSSVPVVLAGSVGALFRGVVQGTAWHWQRVATTGNSSITAIVWVDSAGRGAYASVFGTWPPVLHSVDGGRVWHADTAGLPGPLPAQSLLNTGANAIVLTTMGNGVWERSTSVAWHNIDSGLPAHHGMPLAGMAGSGGNQLFTGTMGYGVYSKNGQAAWRRLGRALVGSQYIVLSLAVAESTPPILVAGTSAGVFRYRLGSA